jgi:hypothetical protein
MEPEPAERGRAVALALEGRDSGPSERASEYGPVDVQQTVRAVPRPSPDIDISDRHPKSFAGRFSLFDEAMGRGLQNPVNRFPAIFLAHRRFSSQNLFSHEKSRIGP